MSLPEDVAELAIQFQKIALHYDLDSMKFSLHTDSKRPDRLQIEISTALGSLDFKQQGRSVAESICLDEAPFEQVRSMVSGGIHKLKRGYEKRAEEQERLSTIASSERAKELEGLARVILLDPPVLDRIVQALDES